MKLNVSYMYLLCYVYIAVLTLEAALLARSQYPEGPATGHLDAGFSWFLCVYKRMLAKAPLLLRPLYSSRTSTKSNTE
jgi:hypothetical protein